MKKVLFVILVSAFTTASFAQGVSGGIKAGVNFANLTSSGSGFSGSADAITSFHGGVYLTAMLSEKIGIQPELLYSMQGTQITLNSTNIKSKTSYINIPVLLRVNIVPTFNIHAGPQIGLLLSAEDNNGTSFKNDLKSTDFGLAFGAGFDLPVGFNGGIRYTLGLSDLNATTQSGFTTKSTNFQIFVGWKLFGAGE
ncbi:porin family protein [soil metagenome]